MKIDDPEYRYPRSRNPYSEKLAQISNRVISDQNTESKPGSNLDWFTQKNSISNQDVLNQNIPLEIEIGCNGGHWIIPYALNHPEKRVIGIDWKFKILHQAAEKAEKAKAENVIFFRAHAIRLPYMFGKNELDRISIFFPDPWPKRKHNKNRLIQESFLSRIHPLLKKSGRIHIKTDHREYFDQIVAGANALPNLYQIESLSYDLYKDHPNPQSLKLGEVTLFERIYIREGLPIHELKLTPL